MEIKIRKLKEDAKLPEYAHKGDAGLDVFSCENVVVKAGERAAISTGIAIELQEGFAALVWDKSGLALKHGIKTMAGVGDSGYRGEYKIVLLNTSKEDFEIKKGDKIAQLLIQKVEEAEILQVEELSKSERNENGFGSSGR